MMSPVQNICRTTCVDYPVVKAAIPGRLLRAAGVGEENRDSRQYDDPDVFGADSLALKLRDAGVSADMICQYVNVQQADLDGLWRMAEAKRLAAQNATDDRYPGCQ